MEYTHPLFIILDKYPVASAKGFTLHRATYCRCFNLPYLCSFQGRKVRDVNTSLIIFSKGKVLIRKIALDWTLEPSVIREQHTPLNLESKLLYVDWCNRFGLVWTSLEKEIHGPKTTCENNEFDCLETTDPLHSAINPPLDGLSCWLSINGHHSVDASTLLL